MKEKRCNANMIIERQKEAFREILEMLYNYYESLQKEDAEKSNDSFSMIEPVDSEDIVHVIDSPIPDKYKSEDSVEELYLKNDDYDMLKHKVNNKNERVH